MAKILVLVRHGKAQSRELGLVDFERKLTGAGRRSLAAWLPKSRRLLLAEDAESFELWASPAARTMQTAQVVAEVWGKRIDGFPRKPHPVDALWNEDSLELLELVERCPSDVVVVCGHNPQMEDLCMQLSGSSIRFATGGVCALRIEDGRLLWFVQGPESRNWKR